jgi:16S rRNA (guanine966-N2)-methyltransferase
MAAIEKLVNPSSDALHRVDTSHYLLARKHLGRGEEVLSRLTTCRSARSPAIMKFCGMAVANGTGATCGMRIISGVRRGHKFEGPHGKTTRPTSELVREALFNILGEAVDGREVIDLFAGTGALGFEALSRGALRATFVERNRQNVALIHRNLATLRFEDRGHVVLGDGYRWMQGLAADGGEPVAVFLDPPYRDFEIHRAKLNRGIEALVRKLPAGSIIAVESRKMLDAGVLSDLTEWDIRRYGETQLAIRFLAQGAPESPAVEPRAEGVPE